MTTSHERMISKILKLAGWPLDDIIVGLQQHKSLSPGMATQAVVSAIRTRGVNCTVEEDRDTGDFYVSYGPSKPHLRLVDRPEGTA